MVRTAVLTMTFAVASIARGAHAAEPAAASSLPATPSHRAANFDRVFFDAFNRCDLAALGKLIAEDLEFFHDLNGTLRGRTAFIEAVRNNVCGKFKRESVPATVESWTLGKEGLIYSGTHRFCHEGKAGCQGQGRFLHVLTEREGQLVLARVVSYDHRALP